MADNSERNEENRWPRFNISVTENANQSADSNKEADMVEKVGDSDPEPTKSEKEKPKKGKRKAPSGEIKGKKRKRKRSPSLSPSSSSSSSSSSDSDTEEEQQPRRFVITSKDEEYNWSLSKEMASYVNEQFSKYIPEKDIEEALLYKQPVPTNIKETKQLDDCMKELVAGNTNCLADATLEKVQKRIRQAMGPIARLWDGIETARKTKPDQEIFVPLDDFSSLVEQTILLLGQSSVSISYTRRMNILKQICKDPRKAKSLLKEKEKLLNQEDADLFGKKFRSYLVDTEKAKNTTFSVFKQKGSSASPFRPGPSSSNHKHSGGGRFVYNKSGFRNRNQNNYNGGQRFGQAQGKKFHQATSRNGKYLLIKKQGGSFLHKVSKSISLGKPQRSSSGDKKSAKKEGTRRSTFSRKAKIFLSNMGKTVPRPRDSKYCKRLQHPFPKGTPPNVTAKNDSNDKQTRIVNTQGNRRDVRERSHPASSTNYKPVFEQYFPSTEKRWGKSSRNKSKKVEGVHTLSTFKNGRVASPPFVNGTGRFPLQNRLERCIFFNSTESGVQAISKILMEGQPVRIYMPVLWLGLCPTDIYQTLKGSYCITQTFKHTNHYLSRRYANPGKIPSEGNPSTGHIDFSVTETRLCDKFAEVHFPTSESVRISRINDKYKRDEFVLNSGKGKQCIISMQRSTETTRDSNSNSSQISGYSGIDSTSSTASPNTVQVLTTGTDPGVKETRNLQGQSNFGGVSQIRTKMVDRKFNSLQRKEDPSKGTRIYNPDGCIQNRMGSILQRDSHGRNLVSVGKVSPYKCTGAISNQVSHTIIHKGPQRDSNTSSNRQQMCIVVPVKNGGHPKHADAEVKQVYLGLSAVQSDHNYSRVSAKQTQCKGRLGVKECKQFLGMEARQKDFSSCDKTFRKTQGGSICLQTLSPNRSVHGLETRSKELSHRCNATTVGRAIRVCFPTLQPNKSNNKESSIGESREVNLNNTVVANTTMVRTTFESLNSKTSTAPSKAQHSQKSSRIESPSRKTGIAKTSGLENFRNSLQMEGISNRAATLISQARREGSLANYESSFQKWTSWCHRDKVDPFQAPLNKILDFLADLFDKGYQYRTINSHRSAISAYHAHIEGKPVGQNPKVCALLAGIFNQRPPQPRYTFIWDVEILIKFIKDEMAIDSKLSDGDLTLKLTALLALTAAQRVTAIQHLNINFMARSSSQVTFYFNKLHKSWRRGKAPPEVTYQGYPNDKSLCIVSTLGEYLDRTRNWRNSDCHDGQLLLSTLTPHNPVKSSTISNWLKRVMGKAGIDTTTFKAHSTRGASTSKAELNGASMEDILKRGSWSSQSTWQKFYKKNIINEGLRFQNSILDV